MKLDRFKFAQLAAWIACRTKEELTQEDIGVLDYLTEVRDPVLQHQVVSVNDVNELLKQMKLSDGFIPAIKAYRALTGVGLKDAKEAVEKYR